MDELSFEVPTAFGGKESWSVAKKKLKRKRKEEVERIDSLSWSKSITIGEDDNQENFPTLFAGLAELDGGFYSLEEIDEADYKLPLPTIGSGKLQNSDGDEETVDEIIEGGEEEEVEEGEEHVESLKIQEKKNVKEHDSSAALNCDVENKVEELDYEEEFTSEFSAWSSMRLHPLLMKSIYQLGFREPTEIQKACFSVAAFQGKDVIGASETGSGKTLAFGLPILQRLLDEREKVGQLYALKGDEPQKYAADGYLRALIITPTRPLALQVTEHLKKAAKIFGVGVVSITGGMSLEKQERLLKRKPEIVVATPGRLWELMSAGEKHLVELQCLSFFVVDEADHMFEKGYFRELQCIIDLLPVTDTKKKRQTFVFSATLALSSDFCKKLKRGSSKPIQSSSSEVNSIEILFKRAGMRDRSAIIDLTTASIMPPKVVESFIKCGVEEKDAYLYYILSVHRQGRTIVFCSSIKDLKKICPLLQILGIDVFKIFREMKQGDQIKAMERFCATENGILVATDGLARGTDIENVRTVIHYQLPHKAKEYIHRCGRTARVSAEGCTIALISPNETSKFYSLCKLLSKESVKIFPVDSSYMPAVRKRLSLARQIYQIQQKGSRVRADKTWHKKHAKLMELELDDEESEEERVEYVRQRKATSAQLTKLQEELRLLLSRPMQPSKFSGRFFAGRGMSPLLQNQLTELTNQKQAQMQIGGDKKRRKLVVVGQDCIEPLEALLAGGKEMMNMKGQSADKLRDRANLRKKIKEEKIGWRDQRRDQKKKRKLAS